MLPPSRLHKERALKAAGIEVRLLPAPALRSQGNGQPGERAHQQAVAAWDHEVDRLYDQMMATSSQPPSEEVRRFAETCRTLGVTEALTALNRQVPHRYTAVYRIVGETMKNIALIDKAGERIPIYLASIPLGLSFCQYVLRDGWFLTSDSSGDNRLNGNPYKGVMVAYHAVPIFDDAGGIFGSLSHFDLRVQPLSDVEFAHLQGVARAIYPFVRD